MATRRWYSSLRRALAASFLGAALLACTTPRLDVPRAVSEAWPRPEETALGRGFERHIAAGQSGIFPLVSGMEAFSVRAGLAEAAERTLDLQYYIVRDDTTAQLLLYRVLRAAERGVRVRLLVDDLDAAGRDLDLAVFSAHRNIEVRVFNPFLRRGPLGLSKLFEFLGDSARLNRRMHNKLWIADNAVAIVGGRNLGDEYFGAHGELNFADLDVLATGPVARDISRSFDAYWNSEWAVPIEAFVSDLPRPEQLAELERGLQARVGGFRETEYALALRDTGLRLRVRSEELPLIAADASALYDPPAKISGANAEAAPRQVFASHMRPIVDAAQREIILISPYFIPNEEGIRMLAALVRRGLRVRLLTNSLASTDYVPLAYAGYARLRVRLLAAGIELYEMRPAADPPAAASRLSGSSSAGYLHAKAIVIDRRHVVVGSMNLDPRSRQSNTEVAVLLESPELGLRLGALFDEAVRPARAFRVQLVKNDPSQPLWVTEEAGTEVRYDREPLTGLWRRFLAKLLGVFAPEDLL